MALIDLSAEIKGESEAQAGGRMVYSVSAMLYGHASHGLGRKPAPPPEPKSEPEEVKNES